MRCAAVVETAGWQRGSRHMQADQFEQHRFFKHNLDLVALGMAVAVALTALLLRLASTGATVLQ